MTQYNQHTLYHCSTIQVSERGACLQLGLEAGAALGDDGIAGVGACLALPAKQGRRRALLLAGRFHKHSPIPARHLQASTALVMHVCLPADIR